MDRYEEKYKKAMAWIDTIMPMLTPEQQEDAKENFPELKESDGEKIRKELLNHFRCVINGEDVEFPPQDVIESWIAWLEKQGGHQKFRDSIQVGDKVTRNEDGLLVNLSQLNRVAKPAEKAEPKFKVGDWVTMKE